MSGITAILSPLFAFYDAVFQPVLAFGPYISLFFFSTLLAALFSVIYWWLLDIERADRIKNKISKYQDRMKEARENDEEEKASEHFKKTLQLNQKFMMLNMKPMLVTMIFVALLFPWLGATYGPTIQMDQINETSFEGTMTFAGQDEVIQAFETEDSMEYRIAGETFTDNIIRAYGMDWQITSFEKTDTGAELRANGRFVDLPVTLPLIGDAFNWLGFYILIVMPMTFAFRKLLGVH